MIHWVCHKELKLLQDKVLMEKCWEEHWELHTKVNLVFIKDQVWFYHVDHLRLIGSVTVRMQMMGRVIIWKIHKELELEIKELYTMVKCGYHTQSCRHKQTWDCEGSGQLLSGGSCEVVIYYNLEDVSEDLKDSAL